MQHLDEYPPPPSHHQDSKIASTRDMQQPAGATVAGPLPPHMTHSNTGYMQPQHSYLAPSVTVAQQDARPDPLPPHLQPMAPPPGRGAPSATAPTARPSGIPEHLQPRPFSHQRATSPRSRPQHAQGQAVQQQHHKQQPLPPMQQVPHYPPQGSATGVRQSGPSPDPGGPTGPMRAAPPTGPEPNYQAQVPYVGGGGSGALPAAAPALDHVSDASATSGWYQGGGPALHQQQRAYGADYQPDYQPAPVYTSAPTASQQLPQQQIQQQHMQRSQAQQQHQQAQQQQAQQQQHMQYPPPPLQQHAAPSQQYQQHPYQQHARPSVADDDPVGQVPRGQQVSGHAPLSNAQGPVLHRSSSGATQSGALEAKQYPPPPVQLKPTGAEMAATPVSFVQLVPQTAGIQVDQSGAVRVVVPPGSQEATAATGAGAAPGQPAMPQHSAAAVYGTAPTRQPQPQHQPESQPHRYGSMGAPPAPAQTLPQHTAKDAVPPAPHQGYDMPPGYQRPASGGSGTAAPGASGPSSAMWDEPAGNHREAAVYAPYDSHVGSGGGGGDGRNYLPAAERSRPQSASQPSHVQQDGGYIYDDPSARPRFPGTGGGGNGASGMERHGSRTPAPDLDGMAADVYGATTTGARRVVVERLGSQGDGSYVEPLPMRPSAGGGIRAQQGVTELPLLEEPPLAEAIRRGEALVAAVMATRADGDLLQGVQQTLLLTCENRMYDLMRALRTAAADAEAARVAAVDAAAEVAKAEADTAAAEAAAAEAEVDIDLGDMRAGNYAFMVDRSIRMVWPLETPEHSLYRTVAEQLLLEEGGRTVPVNNEEVRLKPHEMVGATLCNLPAVQQVVADIRAASGSSTMTLLRQEVGFFDIKEHVHKQTPTSLQWLVRLRADKLPSFSALRHVLRAVVDTVLPAATPSPSSSAAALSKGGKLEARLPPPQQQRQNGGRLPSASPLKGRGSISGDMADADGAGSASAAAASPGLQFLGREPEGEEERLVMRHVALHLLACKGSELGLFQDKIESAVEKLPPALARLYGMGRLHALRQLFKSHPFFWVAQKSVYSSDVLASTAHDCVSLHSNNMLEFQYRARLALQQEQQVLQLSKRRKTGTAGVVAGGGGGEAEGTDHSGTLEDWWLDLRGKRPNLRVGGP